MSDEKGDTAQMNTTHQTQAIRVIGLELRTSNDVAMQTIPPHWQRFFAEGVLAQIPGKQSDTVYAVYTHFEHAGLNNEGLYSLIIGAQVNADAPVPAGLTHCVIPAGPRAVFDAPKGQPERIGETWHEVWSRNDLAKTFIAEYERYQADGSIDVWIGLR